MTVSYDFPHMSPNLWNFQPRSQAVQAPQAPQALQAPVATSAGPSWPCIALAAACDICRMSSCSRLRRGTGCRHCSLEPWVVGWCTVMLVQHIP